MNSKTRPVLLLFALLSVASAAVADVQEGGFYISPMISRIDENSEKAYDSDTGFHLSGGGTLSDTWNIETYLSRFDIDGPASQTQTSLGLDFQRVFRRPARFSPYLFLGAGITEFDLDSGGNEDSKFTTSAGAGFLVDLTRTGRVALRAEYRHRRDRAFSSSGTDDFFSIGLQIPVGNRDRGPMDSDGDGVTDALDRCPQTPPGVSVDATGCALPADSDGDGVSDTMDACPNTPAGVAVDSRGCAPDSDNDGVADYLDQCPGTFAGAVVGADGCELDGDNDGVVDRLDRCPDTRAGAPVDVYGCEIRDEIELPGVNFRTNSAELLPSAEAVLADAAQTLRNNPGITVEVAGHTDSDGAAEYNRDLSLRRANSVRSFLIDQGIDPGRLSAQGYGESQPVADNGTSTGKQANRRVVLRILSLGD